MGAQGSRGTFAVIAGGGTAGHVVPGLAIARELVARGIQPSAVHYVGSERGIETRLVPDAGFPLTVLPGRGIQRRFTLENLRSGWGLVRAIVTAIRLVRQLRPAVVVGLGGYASVPCVIGAIVNRVPVVVAEQNAVPGAANRLAGRFARACAVSFPDTDLPVATWTGNPVRAEVLAAADPTAEQRDAARSRLGVDSGRVLVAVFGGSLGARRINNAVVAALPELATRPDLAIHHVGGHRDHADLVAATADIDVGEMTYTLVEYEDDMPSVYAAADLVLCRSGASSVAELAVTGTPAVLVPLPGAPGDHQTANARALATPGAAVLVPDAELSGLRLVAEVIRLVDDPGERERMAEAARSVARPDAAAGVVDLVLAHSSRPPHPEEAR